MSFYIKNSSQRKNVDGTLSQVLPVTVGVLRRSVLKPPVLFIFIDDMLDLPVFSTRFCYADDTNLLATGSDVNRNLRGDLYALKLWASDDQLSFKI